MRRLLPAALLGLAAALAGCETRKDKVPTPEEQKNIQRAPIQGPGGQAPQQPVPGAGKTKGGQPVE